MSLSEVGGIKNKYNGLQKINMPNQPKKQIRVLSIGGGVRGSITATGGISHGGQSLQNKS